MQASNIGLEALKAALDATAKKRGSTEVIKDYRKIINTVRNSEVMLRQWENYRKDFEYADGIAFEETCDAVVGLMAEIVDCNKVV